MINKQIIFSYERFAHIEHLPLFSIYPCPEDYPRPPAEIGHYPYFIDFKVPELTKKMGLVEYSFELGKKPKFKDYRAFPIPDIVAKNDSRMSTFNEISYLVNALSPVRIFSYSGNQHWTISIEKEMKMIYGQEGYLPPKHEYNLDKIHSLPDYENIDPILLTYLKPNEGKYILRLSELFDLYFNCTDEIKKDCYLNACTVLSKSFDLQTIDWSASYIFMVSALEALIEIENKDFKVENCKSCGQPKYKVSRKFKDFIDKYGYEVDNKTKNEFYKIRSGIAHSGQLLGMSYFRKRGIENQDDLDKVYRETMEREYYFAFKNLAQTCFRMFLKINFDK